MFDVCKEERIKVIIMNENFEKGDKVVHGEELLMTVNNEKAKKFVYELTAIGIHSALALNNENHEVLLSLENLRLLNKNDIKFMNEEETETCPSSQVKPRTS